MITTLETDPASHPAEFSSVAAMRRAHSIEACDAIFPGQPITARTECGLTAPYKQQLAAIRAFHARSVLRARSE